MTKVIFINLYGTLLPGIGEHGVRRGFAEFLENNRPRKIALSAYARREDVERDLSESGLDGVIDEIYTLKDMQPILKFSEKTGKYDGTYPQLHIKSKASRDFGVYLKDCAIISNDPLDMINADWFDVTAFEVPAYNGKDDNFWFGDIVVDSLVNKAKFFSQLIVGKQMKIVMK